MRNYELSLIVHPDVDEEGFNAVVEEVKRTVADNGGQVTEMDPWGKRRLAYPVRKCEEGYYVVMRAQMEQDAIPELERNLKLTENIIRYLLVRSTQ